MSEPTPGERIVLLTLPSVHMVLKAEKALHAAGLVPKVVATPKHLSSDCGFCLSLPADRLDEALALCEAADLPPPTVHPVE